MKSYAVGFYLMSHYQHDHRTKRVEVQTSIEMGSRYKGEGVPSVEDCEIDSCRGVLREGWRAGAPANHWADTEKTD